LPQLKNRLDPFISFLTDKFRQPKATRLFFKALVAYTLLKVLLVWNVGSTVMPHHSISLPKSLPGKVFLSLAYVADHNVTIFFLIATLFLVFALWMKPSYVLNLIFFWLTFNLYVVILPISNGSDVVLFMLALWCIPMAKSPLSNNDRWLTVQTVIYNLGLLFCQLQVVNIYLMSGLDKVMSETWRSGEAFAYVRHLELLYNPVLPDLFANNFWDFIFSWTTILFELSFVVLVWIKKTRLPMLLIGIVFHLFIWIVLSLPDFGMIMILSFLIFLKDEDYERLKIRIRR